MLIPSIFNPSGQPLSDSFASCKVAREAFWRDPSDQNATRLTRSIESINTFFQDCSAQFTVEVKRQDHLLMEKINASAIKVNKDLAGLRGGLDALKIGVETLCKHSSEAERNPNGNFGVNMLWIQSSFTNLVSSLKEFDASCKQNGVDIQYQGLELHKSS